MAASHVVVPETLFKFETKSIAPRQSCEKTAVTTEQHLHTSQGIMHPIFASCDAIVYHMREAASLSFGAPTANMPEHVLKTFKETQYSNSLMNYLYVSKIYWFKLPLLDYFEGNNHSIRFYQLQMIHFSQARVCLSVCPTYALKPTAIPQPDADLK